MTSKDNKREYSTVSLHNKVIEEIDRVMDELGFWPSRSTFVREACLEKIKRERQAAKTNRQTRTAPKPKRKGGKRKNASKKG